MTIDHTKIQRLATQCGVPSHHRQDKMLMKSVRQMLLTVRQEALPAKNYGRDDLMATAAFRYCLGRMTYIVSDCADWLIEQWPNFSDNAKAVIMRDLEEEFARDDEARAHGSTYKPLGHDCDRDEWERVRRLWKCSP